MDDDVAACTKRNIHKRTEKEILDLSSAWEETPRHYIRLDVRSLLQADAITEVEMEVVSEVDTEKPKEEEQKEETEEKKDDEEVSECEERTKFTCFVRGRKGELGIFRSSHLPGGLHISTQFQNINL